MGALAINVGANTSLPGFRGPIFSDGSFVYVPIPEREPTRCAVPTYADLSLPIDIPIEHHDTPVHLDPSFATYPPCESYTYGDEHAVKASRIATLEAGEYLCFYATLSTVDTPNRPWIAPEWGVYLIGHFLLREPPVQGPPHRNLTKTERERFAENAHLKRKEIDPRILVAGDPDGSRLYETAIPLSDPSDGATAGTLVHEHSTDSGAGPWWRRPLRFPDETVILEGSRE